MRPTEAPPRPPAAAEIDPPVAVVPAGVEPDTRRLGKFEPLTARQVLTIMGVAFVGAFISTGVEAHYDLTYPHYVFGAIATAALFRGFTLWLALGDSDVAWADRSASTFMARLRNRLRRLLRIRVI